MYLYISYRQWHILPISCTKVAITTLNYILCPLGLICHLGLQFWGTCESAPIQKCSLHNNRIHNVCISLYISHWLQPNSLSSFLIPLFGFCTHLQKIWMYIHPFPTHQLETDCLFVTGCRTSGRLLWHVAHVWKRSSALDLLTHCIQFDNFYNTHSP